MTIRNIWNATAALGGALLLASSPVTAASPTLDWSGYFAGAYASHNWGKLDTQGNTSHLSTDEDDVWMLGLFGGHRWQLDNDLVAGLAVEIPLLADTGGAQDVTFFPAPAFNPPVTYDYDIDYAFLVVGQLGKHYGRFLPFVEAGVGMLGATYRVRNVNLANAYSPGSVQKADNDHLIWKIGGGLDYKISDRLIGGVRLSYIQSDRQSYEVPWLAPWPAYIGADATSAYFSLAYQFD